MPSDAASILGARGAHLRVQVGTQVTGSLESPSVAKATVSRTFQNLAHALPPVPRGWENSLGLTDSDSSSLLSGLLEKPPGTPPVAWSPVFEDLVPEMVPEPPEIHDSGGTSAESCRPSGCPPCTPSLFHESYFFFFSSCFSDRMNSAALSLSSLIHSST